MPRQYTPHVTLICMHCGTTFTVPPCQAAFTRFCGPTCRRSHPRPTVAVADRFWPRVEKSDGCWIWTGARQPVKGYGVIGIGRTTRETQRVAWELASGAPVPQGLSVLHTCDVRACVRNDDKGVYQLRGVEHPRYGHLWLGTNDDNMADMSDKGRVGARTHPERLARGDRHWSHLHPELRFYGERNPRAILTEDLVRAIRHAYADGQSQSALALEYGVSIQAIWAIVRWKTWRHVT